MNSQFEQLSISEAESNVMHVFWDYVFFNDTEIPRCRISHYEILRMMELCDKVTIRSPMLLDGLNSDRIVKLYIEMKNMPEKILVGINLPNLKQLTIKCITSTTYEMMCHISEYAGPWIKLKGDENMSWVTPSRKLEIDLKVISHVEKLFLNFVSNSKYYKFAKFVTFPNLKNLTVNAGSEFLYHIECPALKTCHINGCWGEKNVGYRCVPEIAPILEELHLDLKSNHRCTAEMFGISHTLKKLTIGYNTNCRFYRYSFPNLEELSIYEDTLNGLDAPKLKKLELYGKNSMISKELVLKKLKSYDENIEVV